MEKHLSSENPFFGGEFSFFYFLKNIRYHDTTENSEACRSASGYPLLHHVVMPCCSLGGWHPYMAGCGLSTDPTNVNGSTLIACEIFITLIPNDS